MVEDTKKPGTLKDYAFIAEAIARVQNQGWQNADPKDAMAFIASHLDVQFDALGKKIDALGEGIDKLVVAAWGIFLSLLLGVLANLITKFILR